MKRGISSIWSVLCVITGILAVCLGVFAVMRAWSVSTLPQLPTWGAIQLVIAAIICAVLTLLFVIAARVSAHRMLSKTRSTSWGIIAIVLSLMLSAGAYSLQMLAPDGVAGPVVEDKAPVDKAEAMKTGVESAYGACPSDWVSMDTSQYPGVSSIAICKDTRTAYATFDNSMALKTLSPLIRNKAVELLEQHSGEAAGTQWATLSGKRWIVVGQKAAAEKLAQSWGGTITDLSSSSEDSGSSTNK